ncbi:MAG TPA: hypothetical protein VGM01_07860 [Ktedonobacteraceae bacterium]
MLTQEERLTIVEDDLKSFKAATVNAYQDVNDPTHQMRGLVLCS